MRSSHPVAAHGTCTSEACVCLLDWIWRYQRLDDGTWVWSTEADGRVQNPTKADNWKAGYHEVRAVAMAIASLRASPGRTDLQLGAMSKRYLRSFPSAVTRHDFRR